MGQRSTGRVGDREADRVVAPAWFATATTPDGPFTVVTADAVEDSVADASTASAETTAGAVLASGWTQDVASLLALIHPSLRPPAQALRQGGGGVARVPSSAIQPLHSEGRPLRSGSPGDGLTYQDGDGVATQTASCANLQDLEVHGLLSSPRQGEGEETPSVGAEASLLRRGENGAGSSSSSPALAQALRALEDYYRGDLEAPGRVPVAQRSGPFRQEAWDVLRGVPAGTVVTYTEYARRCGRPRAVRAAAGACAANAAALFVPCHRVVRADGSLGGFRYGLAVKEALIRRELELRS